MSTRGKTLAAVGVWLAWTLVVAGCAFRPVHTRTRIAPAPAPGLVEARLAPPPGPASAHAAWVPSETSRLEGENLRRFAAAREAFWDHDPDTAVARLRELRAADGIRADHFHDLVLQCYEQSGRWADTLPLYAEFGIEESHAGRLRFAREITSLPPRETILSGQTSVPMTLRHGQAVVIEADINGHKARLLVDTGCERTWICEPLATQAGVRQLRSTLSLHDANNRVRPVPLAHLAELRIGGLAVRNLPVISGRARALQLAARVDGILGWDVLRELTVTWDFPARTLTLARPEGARASAPAVSGRRAPLLHVLSPEGRPLLLFYDSGMSDRLGRITLYANGGVLDAKTAATRFRRTWRPTFSMSAYSIAVKWPRFARDFAFWMAGHAFTVHGAQLDPGELRCEGMALVDGVCGNAPFLRGRLTLCATRRLAQFEPAPP